MPPSSATGRTPRRLLLLTLAPFLIGAQEARAFAPDDRPVTVSPRDASDTRDEYEVKAASLLHFLRYTTWPKDAFQNEKAPIVVEVVGKDPFGSVLDEMFRGKKVGKRSILIRRSRDLPDRIDAHVIFCAGLGKKSREKLIGLCLKRPVLLVGETKGFAADGACINFYVDKRNIRFEINPDAVKQSGLVLSPQLLKLAKIVRTRKRG